MNQWPGGVTIETTSPTTWRRWLARQMRARRLAAGFDQRAVADRLRCTVTKVSYGETAERPYRLRDLTEILLPLYDVPEDEWPAYLEACERSRERGWWQDYDEDVVQDWYARFLGLEQGASTLRGFVMQVVPGLLQTPAYVRTVMAEAPLKLTPEEATGRLEVRLRRQEVLTRRPEPLDVHYVLDEAVLRRVVGGPEVMRDQLVHLAEVATRPNVTLQVLAFERGFYFDGQGEPVILGFPWPDDPGVVYVETRTGGDCLQEPHEVDDFVQSFDHVRRRALSPVESVAMIRDIAGGHR